MKIADYGKAITSYIESPTTAQKLQAKEKANRILLAERDNVNTPDLEQSPDSFLKPGETLEDFDVTFRRPNSSGGRVQLAEGTTPKEKPFTLDQFKDKANIYVGALYSNALPLMDIKSALNKFTTKGIEDGTFTADEAIKVVQDLRSSYRDLAQKQRLRGVIPEGFDDVEREDFDEGGPPGQKINKLKSKSAFRKPYAPEIEKRIIELANNDKLGAQAIADKLTEEFEGSFKRSPVGKRITALKAEGIIKDIPVKEKAASIAMRGDLYDQPAKEKYLKIRDIRDVDRKAIDLSTGKLKYNIPEKARFKVNFGNTGALQPGVVSNIPEEFIGVQYFETKEAAEKALAKRKKLKLVEDVDPDPVRRSANKKKYDLIKEVSDNNIERVLADFKKGQPLEQAHRLSLNQVRKTGEMYNVMNLGLDFDDPQFVQINNEAVKPYENKLKQLYTEQNNLYKKAKNLKVIPKDLQQKIQFNNKKISTVVDLSGGRVQGLQLDEFNLKPKTYGKNYANVLGFGLYDKPVKELTDVDRAGIGAVMQGQIENEKRTAGKTSQKLFENKKFLKNIDVLATTGKILKGASKVIKPLSLLVGPYAVLSARDQAEAAGIDLSIADQAMAFDSGDSSVALENYKRRNDPEFAAQERAKDLARITDDFEEVGQTTFGKYNDQIKNIKLP